MRRIPTHVIEFQTMHDGLTASLAPGDYIKVAMEETEYDEFNNGVVTPEGALVSTTKLADGSYSVIAWDGTEGTPPSDLTLVVKGNTATPAGIVFTVKSTDTQVRVYQVERITPSEDGGFTINAMHMPVNDLGILQVADGFDNDTNWVIEG
jgi:predicted phage tail protein